MRRSLSERNGVTGKECTKCNEWKPLEDYGKHKRGLGGKNSACKECFNKNTSKWYRENKDRKREYDRKWLDQNKEYVQERDREYNKQYFQENREKFTMKDHKRRAMEKALPSNWTKKEKKYAFIFFGGCALTGEKDIHFDHVIPIVTGHGGTTKENMIPLRSDLNLSKNGSNIFEWYKSNKERFDLSDVKFTALIEYLSKLNGMTPQEYQHYVYKCHEPTK